MSDHYTGATLVIGGRRRWYVRLWHWITRRKQTRTITGYNPETRTITVDRPFEKGKP